jgi:ABC-2 type transport system ATP-binding protein
MSSHAMAEVMELSDRLIVIDNGRLITEGTPAEIIARGGGGDLEAAFLKLTGVAA